MEGKPRVIQCGMQRYCPCFACTYMRFLQLISTRQNSTIEYEMPTRLGSKEPGTGGWMNEGGKVGIIRTLDRQLLVSSEVCFSQKAIKIDIG